jgi:nucleoside-diphosphate-sugar epimerase
MAFHRAIEAAHGGAPFPMRGDGSQVRDNTYVDDAVAATIAALDADLEPGWIGNVGGGEPTSLRDTISLVEEISGRPVPVTQVPAAPGDPGRTAADLTGTRQALGWEPVTPLRAGLTRQVAWQRRSRSSRSAPLPATALLTRAASN